MAAVVLDAFLDTLSRAIMNSIISSAKSIEDIAAENKIPLSTAYRRVHELCYKGLVIVERIVISDGGKKHAIFRSAFQGATADFQTDGVVVAGIPNKGIPDIAFRLWQFNNEGQARASQNSIWVRRSGLRGTSNPRRGQSCSSLPGRSRHPADQDDKEDC